MALSPEAKRRLEIMNRQELAEHPAGAGEPAAGVAAGSLSENDWLQGTEIAFPEFGCCFQTEKWVRAVPGGWDGAPERWRQATTGYQGRTQDLRQLCGADPQAVLFVDIETTGLSISPLFLVGIMEWREGDFRVQQLLARTLEEEQAVLRVTGERLAGPSVLVSFNGLSFDLPYIRRRADYHGAPCVFDGPHVDVLLHARSRWNGLVPNCRLQTLEAHILGRQRVGDVPSHLVPDVYHRFLQNRDATLLAPILQHNLIDLVSTAELLTLLLKG